MRLARGGPLIGSGGGIAAAAIAAAALAAAVVLAVVAGLGLGGCDRPPSGPASPAPHLETRGVTVGDWTRFGIASGAGQEALDAIAATGAGTAVFVVTVYQAGPTSSDFGESPATLPNLQAFQQAAAYAQGVGLDVALKLHVDVSDGTWRANIDPADPAAWFRAYGAILHDCAAIAESVGARYLVVGTELAGTTRYEASWRSLIAGARERFRGVLLYAASWDEAEGVRFQDVLDGIGINFYYPVASREDPSRAEILAAWQPWLVRIESLARRTGRDIFLTEIGYMSQNGAGMEPSMFEANGSPDADEQADLYWAALEAIAGAERVRGIWWWNWELGVAGGPSHLGYTPCGKPALQVLTEVWSDR